MAIQTPQKPAAPSRMRLDSLVRGKQERPFKVFLYSVEGIGKSTWASQAPAPIFIGPENGTGHLDVTRFPQPETLSDVKEAINVLLREEHGYKTLVIDTVDWLEPMIWDAICARDGQENIEAYGYGKGYVAALDEWRIVVSALERLWNKGMNIVLLGHCWIKPFKNPEGPDFDRYEPKLHAKASGLLKEWVEAVLFANYETFAERDKQTKRVKGVSTDRRLVYTQRKAAYDAKNRYDLPESLALDWHEFEAAAKAHRPADPRALEAAIRENASHLDDKTKATILAAIERAQGNAAKLAQLNSFTNQKVAEATNG